MDSPVIQLRFKGRLVQTLSFQSDLLRIGRMRENDIVISNASVSRFHAVLKRENGQVILEDSGSENGCYVNGTRVESSIALEPGDEVLIGKHQLVLCERSAEEPLPGEAAEHGKNDAWDASKTYFVAANAQAAMPEGDGSEPAADLEEEPDPLLPAELQTTAGEETSPQGMEPLADAAAAPCEDTEPEPMEVAAEELEAWAPAASEIAEAGEPAESLSSAALVETSGKSPFGFGIDADLASSGPGAKLEVDPEDYDVELIEEEPEEAGELAAELAESSTPELQSSEEPIRYAGLIIQNRGKLERIISWDRDRLSAGRSPDCEIFLDQPEISRRHAMFVQEDERYEVRDLDSINGILVNGEKIRRRDLEVGDVVKIEDFELTFVLDRQPLDSEIVTDDLATPREAVVEDSLSVTMIDEHLPISSDITDPSIAEEPPALVEEEPEDSLFGHDDAEKEDLVEVEAVSLPLSEAADPAVPVATDDVVTFELKVRREDLPPSLRRALAQVDERELRLPVELVLKTDC